MTSQISPCCCTLLLALVDIKIHFSSQVCWNVLTTETKAGDQVLEALLSYIASLRSVWAT